MGTPGNATLISDAVLLEQYARTRDAEAFAELVRRHAGFVYGTALRVTRNADDAEDVAQECFLELARKAGAITSSLAGWLHKAAMHRSANAVRRLSRRRRHERRAAVERYDEVEPTWNDIAPHVDKALGRLPEELRVPIILHYFGGHSQSQIASELSVSQPTVSRRLEKGVAELRRRLKAAGIVPSVAVLMALLAENAATAAPDTLMISLGKMAIAGAGKGGSAAGAASCAGSAEGSSAFPTTLVGTPGGKIALVVAAGAVVLVGAMAVRHEPIPTPHAPAAHTPVRALAAANREMTNVSPGGRRAGGGRTPTRDAKRGDTVRVQAAPPDVPAGGFGMWGAASPKAVAPGDVVIQALTAKAAAVRDYHYRLEWTMAGVHVSTAEVWCAGPERMRVAMTYAGQQRPWREIVVKGGDVHDLDLDMYRVTKSGASDAYQRLVASGEDTMGPVFLTEDLLGLWQGANVKGTEAMGGMACHIVDVISTGGRLSGSLLSSEDFVAFVPHACESEGMRFWVDGATGMVRRWERLKGGRTVDNGEVVETQDVNGFAFPAVMRMGEGDMERTGRVTEAAVNQGVEGALAGFHPPPQWLVNDETLTLAQARERLQAAPDDAHLHYTLGTLYWQRERTGAAAHEFRRAADLAPQSPSPLLALGLVLTEYTGEDTEAAIEALREAKARGGEDSWLGRMRLARRLMYAGKWDEAVGEYRQLTAFAGPPGYWAMRELAPLLAGRGDDPEGAYRATSDVPLAMLLAGMPAPEAETPFWRPTSVVSWASKCNHLDDLRKRAEQALAEDPGLSAVRLVLAKVLHAQGDKAAALEALEGIPLEFESVACDVLEEIVSLACDLGNEELLVRIRSAAIRRIVEDRRGWMIDRFPRGKTVSGAAISELIRAAAELWTKATDTEARVAVLDTLEDANSSVCRSEEARAAVLAREPSEMTPAQCAVVGELAAGLAVRFGKPEVPPAHAEACFLRALTEWPNDAALWAALGGLRWRTDDRDGAVEAYARAAAAQPDQIEYAARAAFYLIWLDRKRRDQALEMGRKALQPWPEGWAARAFFASLQMDCGQLEAARDTLAAVYAMPELPQLREKTWVALLLARCQERLGEADEHETEAILKRELAECEAWVEPWVYSDLIEFYGRHNRTEDAYATAKMVYVQQKDVRNRDGLHIDVDWEIAKASGGDREALLATVRADLGAHPDDANTVALAADIYDCIGMQREALPLRLRLAETANNDLRAWIRLADTAARVKDGEVLVKALRRALDLRPHDRELQSRYARAAAAQGNLGPAKTLADELRAKAGKLPQSWREVAELYLTAQSWDDALAAAEHVLALTPETDEPAQMRAQILAAQAYVGKRDDREARRRLIPILAQSNDPSVLREAAEALVDLYLLREEREQAIATLNDLRLRTQDRGLLDWIDQRLKGIAGD